MFVWESNSVPFRQTGLCACTHTHWLVCSPAKSLCMRSSEAVCGLAVICATRFTAFCLRTARHHDTMCSTRHLGAKPSVLLGSLPIRVVLPGIVIPQWWCPPTVRVYKHRFSRYRLISWCLMVPLSGTPTYCLSIKIVAGLVALPHNLWCEAFFLIDASYCICNHFIARTGFHFILWE